MIAIYKRLRELREYHHYTQEYVSSHLHVERPSYSNYECGKRNPPIELLVKLADFYKVSIYDMLCNPNFSPGTAKEEYPWFLTKQDERVLIRIYRLLSDNARREALQLLQFKLQNSNPA